MNSTGENEKGLKEILDFTRLAAIAILLIHFYFYCYGAFKQWHLTAEIGDRFLQNFIRTGLFKSIFILSDVYHPYSFSLLKYRFKAGFRNQNCIVWLIAIFAQSFFVQKILWWY